MKKLFVLLLLSVSVSSIQAQLPNGTIAPDFTLKDLNGNTHHLYDYLAQGKTVFLDISAAWCHPCWQYHQSGALENFYAAHGPAGMSGVNANTTNNAMVFLIEGESYNTTAQLYGVSGTGVMYSQGNWVTGTPYPIIDTNAAMTNWIKSAYNISAFPTIYMICRDRLIYRLGQINETALYAALQQDCPAYAPSATLDAKVTTYNDKNYFFCSGKPTVSFQNYSTASNITSAAIKVYDGANTLATTYNWTGTLAPYAIASVPIPGFAATQLEGYRYEVHVPGDSHTGNDNSPDSLFKVYGTPGLALPYHENFDGNATHPGALTYPTSPGNVIRSAGTLGIIYKDPAGSTGHGVVFNFWVNPAGAVYDFIIGGFNTASLSGSGTFEFDLAYGQNSGLNDKLELLISKDCGATWTTAWSKSGAALATTSAQSTMFTPTSAGQWRHESVTLASYRNSNMLLKFRGTSDYGNNAWIDNLKITGTTTGVQNIPNAIGLRIAPNPSREAAAATFTVPSADAVTLTVTDMTGRVCYWQDYGTLSAGAHTLSIPAGRLAVGIYLVNLRAGGESANVQMAVAR